MTMLNYASKRVGRTTALIGVLASICASLAVVTPAPASAERYCWGAFLPGLEATCSGPERFGTEVKGMGEQHSVCVAIAPFGPIKCSSGPGVWVTNNYGSNKKGAGWIQDNASGGTTAYGEIF
jgi:hypothetical protein